MSPSESASEPRYQGGGPTGQQGHSSSTALSPAKSAELERIRKMVNVWEAKLAMFAEKFADNPEALLASPTWAKLVKVRDSLRSMLAKHDNSQVRISSLDKTRMRRRRK